MIAEDIRTILAEVAARRGGLPELIVDAGLLVDPRHGDEFADALLAAACDLNLRERLIAAGMRRAAAYTWRRTAAATDRVIGSLLADPAIDCML
jgi:glycosyltransferase involved in cell wall biosynthesis